ncbi:hypothetical protein Tco_1031460, partial [Tanacetum coccineum]
VALVHLLAARDQELRTLLVEMSQLQSESRVAQSLLCLLRKRLKSGPKDYNGLIPLSYHGADVFILALSLISIASYVNFPKKKTSRKVAKYVANGGIIGVVSTATYESFVSYFGLISELKADPSQMIDIYNM